MAALVCPLKFAGPVKETPTPSGLKEVPPVCVEAECAWWTKNGCAVLVVAKTLVIKTKESK